MNDFSGELDTMRIEINNGTYECRICASSLTSPIQLTVHYIVRHGYLLCVHCLKLFENDDVLTHHLRKEHAAPKHSCLDCKDDFSTEEDFLTHATEAHEKKYCGFCGMFISLGECQEHAAKIHKVNSLSSGLIVDRDEQKLLRCSLCQDNKSVNLDKLILHCIYFHKYSLHSVFRCIFKNNPLRHCHNSDDRIKCGECNVPYTWRIPKIYHKVYCEGATYCSACKMSFDDPNEYNAHSKNCCEMTGMPALCDSCCSVAQKALHYKTEHKWSTFDQTLAVSNLLNARNDCSFCAINLPSQLDEVIGHFRNTHRCSADAILSLLKKCKDQMKSLPSEQKNTRKNEQTNLAVNKRVKIETKEHANNDNVERYVSEFDTKIVKYIYSSASDYDSSDEDEDAPRSSQFYQCASCNRRYKRKFVFLIHMHERHGFALKTLQFNCKVCRKLFATNNGLRKHNQKAHHKSTDGKRFSCPFCEFRCNGKAKMRLHIGEHVEASYHPCNSKSIGYNCNHCHFIFWTKDKLSVHELSRHSEYVNDNYMLCSLCFAAFTNLASLRCHIATRHHELHLEIGYNAFQCTICLIVLFSFEEIRGHVEQLHPEFQSLYCAKNNCKQILNGVEGVAAHWNEHK